MSFNILRVHYLPKPKGSALLKKKKSHINLISYIWCYLFNLLKIKINKITKLMLQTYAVHVEDTTRYDTRETALQ